MIKLTYGIERFTYADESLTVDSVTRAIQYVRSGRGAERGFLEVVHTSGTTYIDLNANVPILIEEVNDAPVAGPIEV